MTHLQAGRHLDAQMCCQEALAADSNDPDALYLMGLLSLHAKQYDHAAAWLSRAIEQNKTAKYLAALGTAFQHQGRFAEALKAVDEAIQLKADDAGLWKARGALCTELKLSGEALRSFQQALKFDPHNCDIATQCGLLLYRMGRLEEAYSHFDRCAELQPNVQTLYRRGRVLIDLGKPQQALVDHQRAHALDPTSPDICNNTGVILRSLGREEEALQWFDRAVALQPNSVEALNNRAVSLGQLQRFDEAFATYRRVKALDTGNAEIDWNVAVLQLLTGDFAAGWAGRKARWKRAYRQPYPQFTQPKWLGEEAVEGKTILVCTDEGLGDTIQFIRYVPMLAARGARVILLVSDPLVSLLSGLPGVSQCFPLSDFPARLAFDMHCPMSGLPLAFGTRQDTIPSAISYLPSPENGCIQAWEERLGPRHKLRVGLVWSGNPKHKNDHNRSISFRRFLRLCDGIEATFVSLQKEPRPDDKAALSERAEIIDLSADLTDFSDTAALVSCLDLVITVDTSVAHLAGALGCRTWILLPYTPDWRWLLDRDDSPWYPTVRLFRQGETRQYDDVLERTRAELQRLIAAE
ncbi:MAG TPA: tetratricopeptide repeat-containing glycosyltransferase family protein [Bradyrhizobium sp.]|nr:tetratricopeptide repeat-containing glycosyltransferase family protein [Bradyrhizobium sp.]